MKQLIVIFLGSGLGGVTRYGLGRWIENWHNHYFPFGTLAVNVVACLVLGVVIGLADHRQMLSSTSKLFLTVGFCGGFSTFSTFSNETLHLFQQGNHWASVLYALLSILLCVVAVFGGLLIAERI